jgi:ASC-1-like (ASCH) protein
MNAHVLWVTSRLLSDYREGRRRYEVRPNDSLASRIAIGDEIQFNEIVFMKVRAISIYPSFHKLLAHVPASKLWQGHTQAEILIALQETWGVDTTFVRAFEIFRL